MHHDDVRRVDDIARYHLDEFVAHYCHISDDDDVAGYDEHAHDIDDHGGRAVDAGVP